MLKHVEYSTRFRYEYTNEMILQIFESHRTSSFKLNVRKIYRSFEQIRSHSDFYFLQLGTFDQMGSNPTPCPTLADDDP